LHRRRRRQKAVEAGWIRAAAYIFPLFKAVQFGYRFQGGGRAYPDTWSYDGSDHWVCARIRRSRVDFPPTPPGRAAATGPRWGLLAHIACR